MPTYTFKNKDTGEYEEHFMSINDLDKFIEDNPNLKKLIDSPGVTYASPKIPDGFRDRLKEIKKNTPGATFEIP